MTDHAVTTDIDTLEVDEPGRRRNLIAVAIAAVTGAVLASASFVQVGSDDGGGSSTTGRSSLFAQEGWTVLVVLAVPTLLTIIPLLFRSPAVARGARLAVTVFLVALVLLGAASVGLFFVPTAIAMGIAAAAAPPPPAPT